MSKEVKSEKGCMFYENNNCKVGIKCDTKGDKCCGECIKNKVKCLKLCDYFN